ncbi:MAG TPA: biotin transporter BioY [Edaphobacter sp.]|jgi:biotin transport system substrate-specific component|nr:biotin transporter BioY [Edaphobacter sp.]
MQSTIPSQLGLAQRSGSLQESLAGKTLLVISATAFVAACAHISLPLPFTPVPLTLQNFAVILVGMALGPLAGFSAMVLYLAEGAIGLPVFTPSGGPAGVAHLLGPNGGFLFSYPLAAATAGWVVRAMQPLTTRFRSALAAATAATLPIFLLGAGWLAFYANHSISATWSLAVAPFIPGEIVKITAAAGIFSSLQRWRQS